MESFPNHDGSTSRIVGWCVQYWTLIRAPERQKQTTPSHAFKQHAATLGKANWLLQNIYLKNAYGLLMSWWCQQTWQPYAVTAVLEVWPPQHHDCTSDWSSDDPSLQVHVGLVGSPCSLAKQSRTFITPKTDAVISLEQSEEFNGKTDSQAITAELCVQAHELVCACNPNKLIDLNGGLIQVQCKRAWP